MKRIQEAVRAYLQDQTGVRVVSDRTRARGEYPLLAVAVREDGAVLLDGGRQAEHTYQVTITAVSDRDREGNTALLAGLPPLLLRGVPMGAPAGAQRSGSGGESSSSGESELSPTGGSEGYGACEKRVLHPLEIATEGEELTFSVRLCVPVPPPEEKPGQTGPGLMQTLRLGV